MTAAVAESETQTAVFASSDEVKSAFALALPELACKVCGSTVFALLDKHEKSDLTRFFVYGAKEFETKGYIPTVSIACENCGHIMQFAEKALKQLAERKRDGG